MGRWNSPYINHFLQPDSIIPDQTNPQSWDRYAYSSNNPMIYIDPTGHDDIPWWTIFKFLAGQLTKNGEVSGRDWEQAANTYIPAIEKGSNLTAQASATVIPASGVVEANYVTTEAGEFQLFITTGKGVGGGVGASVGYSQGAINGDGFVNADSFGGQAGQITAGGNSPVALGASVDGWAGIMTGSGGEPVYNGVYGYDTGPSLGTLGVSAAVTIQNAVPAGDVVESILTDTGLIGTSLGQAYNNYAQSVTSFKMNGFELFACRAASQCGRWSYKDVSTEK